MPNEKELITTQADRLLEVIKEKGELSLEDAAKEMGMPIKTIESYANFFEEEGILGIKYKFTTPFLSMKKKEDKAPDIQFDRKGLEDAAGFQKVLKEVQEQFNVFEIKLKSGEYYLLKEKLPDFLNQVRNLLSHKHSGLNVKDADKLQKLLAKSNTRLKAASKDVDLKKFNLAKNDFSFIYTQIKEILGQIHTRSGLKLGLKTNEDMTRIIKDIQSSVAGNDFKTANELLGFIEEFYKELPNQFRKQEIKIKTDIEGLRKDISEKHARHIEKEMEKQGSKVLHLIRLAKRHMEKGDVLAAIKIFNSLKTIYLNLPKGFLRKKLELSNEILQLYRELSTLRFQYLERSFVQVSGQLRVELREIKAHVNAKRFNKAIASYNRVVWLFNSLPKINAPVRDSYKQYLLLVYEKLSAFKRSYLKKNLKKITNQISSGVNKTKGLLQKRDIVGAKAMYDKLLALYRSIPKEHTEVLLTIQMELFQLFNIFARVLDDEGQSELQLGLQKINSMLEELENTKQQNMFEEAMGLYQKILVRFNMLPKGFIKIKEELREKLIEEENEIKIKLDSSVLRELTVETRHHYHRLLNCIALFYVHIESEEFDLALVDYRQIKTLTNRLPFGIITGSKLISSELKNVHAEASALNKVIELEKDFKNKKWMDGRAKIAEFNYLMKKLDKTEPHVLGLYRRLKRVIEGARPHFKGKSPSVETRASRLVTKQELLKSFESSVKPQEQTEIPKIEPLTKEEEKELGNLAARIPKSDKQREEFEQLKRVVGANMVLDSPNKATLISNKLKMAKMFSEFGKKDRVKQLIKEVLELDPDNKQAKGVKSAD